MFRRELTAFMLNCSNQKTGAADYCITPVHVYQSTWCHILNYFSPVNCCWPSPAQLLLVSGHVVAHDHTFAASKTCEFLVGLYIDREERSDWDCSLPFYWAGGGGHVPENHYLMSSPWEPHQSFLFCIFKIFSNVGNRARVTAKANREAS
jgi:hypothetical protein